jgi:hypothetical protein
LQDSGFRRLDAVFVMISEPTPTTKPALFSETVLPLSVEF